MSFVSVDEHYMRMALELARKGEGFTSPNPMVGAVVVKDGKVVGRGYHVRAGAAHAEVVALQEAGEGAQDATLYVNLEPCCHYGRTGPCVKEIVAAKVKKVVVAMVDPNPLVAGKGLAFLREAGLEVVTGVLAAEAERLNEVFCKYITTGFPFVVAKAALSLDGKIATRSGESRWITGEEARVFGHRLRHRYDAILVGVNTVLRDNPSLTARLPEGRGKDPVRVVLDSFARTPPEVRVIRQESPSPAIIAVTQDAPRGRITALEEAGAEVVVTPAKEGRVDLAWLMKELAEREITSVLIEGGGEVHASALAAGMVDKVVFFIAPLIIGGKGAPGPVGGQGAGRLAEAVYLQNINVLRVGQDICVEGYIRPKKDTG
ncbi:MAG: bifunctional diaminohydroxyphosphoribosylaminopyrimidine deaminase/5-amino-6-(5-phosphoribosylamino)uracil reductase RibD [Desulfotomaculales bacterium]